MMAFLTSENGLTLVISNLISFALLTCSFSLNLNSDPFLLSKSSKEFVSLQFFLNDWQVPLEETNNNNGVSLNFVHDFEDVKFSSKQLFNLIYPSTSLLQASQSPWTILGIKSIGNELEKFSRWKKSSLDMFRFSSRSRFLNFITISRENAGLLEDLNKRLRLNFQNPNRYNIFWNHGQRKKVSDDDNGPENNFQQQKEENDLVDSFPFKNWLNKVEIIPTTTYDDDRDHTKNSKKCHYILASICHYCGPNGGHLVIKSKPMHGPWSMEQLILSAMTMTTNFNFHGHQLNVGKGHGLPVVMRHQIAKNGTMYPTGGFQVPMLRALEGKMNFSSKFSAHFFGTLLPNGTYTGLVGKLMKEELDLVIAAVGIADRYSRIRYLTINSIHYIGFVSRAPRALLKWTAIFMAFSYEMWLLLCAVGYLVVLPFYIFLQLSGAFRRRRRKKRADRKLRKLIYPGFLFLSRPLIEQQMTTSITPTQFPGRIFCFFWLLCAILFSLNYKSALTSIMVHPSTDRIPQSFDELSNSNFEIYMNFVGGGLEYTVMSTTSPAFVKIRKKMKVERNLARCVQYAVEKERAVCAQGIISVVVEGNLNFTDRHGRSTFKASAATAFPFLLAMLCPKNAVYAPRMDDLILRYVDSGLLRHAVNEEPRKTRRIGMVWAKAKWKSNKKKGGVNKNDDDGGEGSESGILQARHLSGTVILYVIGMLAACSGFVMERILWRSNNSISKKNKKRRTWPQLYRNQNGQFGFYYPTSSSPPSSSSASITQVEEAHPTPSPDPENVQLMVLDEKLKNETIHDVLQIS